MNSGKDFEKFSNKELSDLLPPLEQERRKVSARGIFGYVFLFLGALFFMVFNSNHSGGAGFIFITCLVAGIILLLTYSNKKKKYVAGFKEIIIRRIIRFIDPTFQYSPGCCVSEDDYTGSGLYLERSDRYTGDDLIEGKRDKTLFCFSDLHTERKVSSGKSSHWETIFKGLFFIGDFNKNFQNRTYVYSEQHPQINFFTKLFSSFTSGLEKVKLESTEFEKRFIVYSGDQVEARYILTPSLMERMVKLEETMGRGISFSFVKTKIYVAVPLRENLFEPSVFSQNSYGNFEGYYNTVQIVFDIIDELKLNERLWNKE